jgi:hypothetical protein
VFVVVWLDEITVNKENELIEPSVACYRRKSRASACTLAFNTKKGSVRMKNWKGLAAGGLAAAIVFVVSGCAYMHVQMPMGTNFDNTQLGTREGRSSSYSLLWLVAWGDAGTKAAATQGDIKIIRYADTEVKLVLFGMYTRRTTIVYGD